MAPGYMKTKQKQFQSVIEISKRFFFEIYACGSSSRAVWDKVWVKPQGCVVKVFPMDVSKDTESVPQGGL